MFSSEDLLESSWLSLPVKPPDIFFSRIHAHLCMCAHLWILHLDETSPCVSSFLFFKPCAARRTVNIITFYDAGMAHPSSIFQNVAIWSSKCAGVMFSLQPSTWRRFAKKCVLFRFLHHLLPLLHWTPFLCFWTQAFKALKHESVLSGTLSMRTFPPILCSKIALSAQFSDPVLEALSPDAAGNQCRSIWLR